MIKHKLKPNSATTYATANPWRPLLRAWLLLVVLSTGSQVAVAHTRLLSSEPAAGVVLQAAPKRVTLQFSAPPEKGFTEIAWSQDGRAEWRTLEVTQAANRVEAALPQLAQGRYKIRWSVLSRDGHRQRGVLQFQIH